MIFAIDVGNTRTKAVLIDETLNIVTQKNWSTPEFFEPDRWNSFFDEMYALNPLFFIAELRISCVSWRAFLSLRVYLGYDTKESFDINKEFNEDLLILPINNSVILESDIPINREFVTGMVGTDRLLAAYAAHKIFKKNTTVVCLGTATTIDLITGTGVFFSGSILPGIDVSYQGLLDRATSLPPLSDLPLSDKMLNTNTTHSLYTGLFLSQALVIEEMSKKQIQEASLKNPCNVVLTGGRSYSISSHIRKQHDIVENLVAYGLALIPKKNDPIKESKFDKKHLKNIKIINKAYSPNSRILDLKDINHE